MIISQSACNKSVRMIVLILLIVCFISTIEAENYYHLVILGDPHLPGKEPEIKRLVVDTINLWNDVTGVVVLGDICSTAGIQEEYDYAQKFFSTLKKTMYFINGNHDYRYIWDAQTQRHRTAYKEIQIKKLEQFKKTFIHRPDPYYLEKIGGYLLIFLAVDKIESEYLATISEKQMNWLSSQLEENKKLTTIVFFHAPLNGTLFDSENKNYNQPKYIAQPEDKIKELLKKNSQIFLWISGHTHTSPFQKSYASEINLYENQVMNIHNSPMNPTKDGIIWTNSLYLYPDKVVIRTYNHKLNEWQLERTILTPAKK